MKDSIGLIILISVKTSTHKHQSWWWSKTKLL